MVNWAFDSQPCKFEQNKDFCVYVSNWWILLLELADSHKTVGFFFFPAEHFICLLSLVFFLIFQCSWEPSTEDNTGILSNQAARSRLKLLETRFFSPPIVNCDREPLLFFPTLTFLGGGKNWIMNKCEAFGLRVIDEEGTLAEMAHL